jgi:hypothetical protein
VRGAVRDIALGAALLPGTGLLFEATRFGNFWASSSFNERGRDGRMRWPVRNGELSDPDLFLASTRIFFRVGRVAGWAGWAANQ